MENLSWGKTRLYVVPLGFIENDLALNLLLHNQATIEQPSRAAEWTRVPSICLLICQPKLGWILVDTGSHPEAMNGYWPEEARKKIPLIRTKEDMLDYRLSQLGLTAQDIDWLVLTHLHLDHAGNLRLFSGTKAGQRIIAAESEIKQALYMPFIARSDLASGYLRPDFDRVENIAFEPIEENVKLFDDIELLYLPGHTAGTIGVMVHLENTGVVIYTSDAANSAENFGPPVKMSAVFYDSVAMNQSSRKLRWMQRQHNAMLIFGHDMEQYKTLRLSPDGFYD